jgi:hypothetical protein
MEIARYRQIYNTVPHHALGDSAPRRAYLAE